MIEAVIFDHDGTLLETESAWWRAEIALFERYGRTFTPDHKRALLGSSPVRVGVLLAGLLEQPDDRAGPLSDALYELAIAEVGKGVPPMPGALELHARVRAAGKPLGLATNARRDFLDAALRGAGLGNGHFDATLAADEVDRPKPDPDLYLRVADALGAAPAACLALEDSPTGVAAARAAGMVVVGVPSVPGVELTADLVCDSLADPRVAGLAGV